MSSTRTPSRFAPIKKKIEAINKQSRSPRTRTWSKPTFPGASIKSSGRREAVPTPPLIQIETKKLVLSDGVKAGYVAKVLAEHLPNIASFEERKALILSSLPK